VERLLEGLDERDRLMLILKEVEGFSIEDRGSSESEWQYGESEALSARRRVVSQAKKRGDETKAEQPGGGDGEPAEEP